MTGKSDDRVGHFNTILARGGGNFKDPIFKCPGFGQGGGGVLKFRVFVLLFTKPFKRKSFFQHSFSLDKKVEKQKLSFQNRFLLQY